MNLSGLLDNNVIAGSDTLFDIEKILSDGNYQNILLITGKSSFESCSAKDLFYRLDNDFTRISFSGKTLQTSFIDDHYNSKLKDEEFDLIIGIGGGSVLDTAKIFSIMLSNNFINVDRLIDAGGGINKIPLVLIPTTAGPASEATSFAVLYKDHTKYSIASKSLNVKHIILDPNLLINMPQQLLRITLLDALSQAIESMWSINSTQESIEHAKTALRIFSEQKLLTSEKVENLEKLFIASHIAGKAINISRTTAAHAFSYPLTSHFSIPHGLAVSVFLMELIRFNLLVDGKTISDVRGVKYVKDIINDINEILGFKTVELFQNNLANYIKRLEFRFDSIQMVSKNQFTKLISDGINEERLKNNPRKISAPNAQRIITNIYSFLGSSAG